MSCLLVRGKYCNSSQKNGYQGADGDAEKLGLTNQLSEAVLCELADLSRGSTLFGG